mmetsp:Transcript_125692/g.367209  ORF Transcript_125692/g.367209 Transcript_125692/m.367209 type:complete len:247 (-) Transcript_125692:221-961(-)
MARLRHRPLAVPLGRGCRSLGVRSSAAPLWATAGASCRPPSPPTTSCFSPPGRTGPCGSGARRTRGASASTRSRRSLSGLWSGALLATTSSPVVLVEKACSGVWSAARPSAPSRPRAAPPPRAPPPGRRSRPSGRTPAPATQLLRPRRASRFGTWRPPGPRGSSARGTAPLPWVSLQTGGSSPPAAPAAAWSSGTSWRAAACWSCPGRTRAPRWRRTSAGRAGGRRRRRDLCFSQAAPTAPCSCGT